MALAIIACIVLVQHWHSIVSFIKSIENIHPSASPEEQTAGLVAFGLLIISILALVRILVHQPRK
ncbi:MAG: hypothetical protein IPK26_22295 [Planctomycetes bacterium]|nr:hypothetical protein [Planctomycetota bacterium]